MTNGSHELADECHPALLPATGLAVPTIIVRTGPAGQPDVRRDSIRGFARRHEPGAHPAESWQPETGRSVSLVRKDPNRYPESGWS